MVQNRTGVFDYHIPFKYRMDEAFILYNAAIPRKFPQQYQARHTITSKPTRLST